MHASKYKDFSTSGFTASNFDGGKLLSGNSEKFCLGHPIQIGNRVIEPTVVFASQQRDQHGRRI